MSRFRSVSGASGSRKRWRSPPSDDDIMEDPAGGDNDGTFPKADGERSFYEGSHEDVPGIFFRVEFPKSQEMRDLLGEFHRRGSSEVFCTRGEFEWTGCRPDVFRTLLGFHGVELDSSRFQGQGPHKKSIHICAIVPGSPAARDGRLKVGDCLVKIKNMGSVPITVGINRMLNEDLVLFMFRPYGASGLGPSGNDALLAPQFCAEVLENPKFADLVFEVGNEKIPSYRLLVTARSPVLEAMLTHDMKEKKTGRIKIEDFEPSVIRTLLAFIYSGRLELKENSIAFLAEVARAGDFFGIKGLKERALQILYFWVTPETAVDILLLANKCVPGEEFIDRVLTFIALWSTKVKSHPSFASLKEHPDLLLRLVDAMSEAVKTERKFVFEQGKAILRRKQAKAPVD